MKTAALVFDDGPSEWTPPILDLLKQHAAHATFFVLGTKLDEYRDTLCRTAWEGHELAVHGWDHTPVDAMDTRQLQESLMATYGLIKHRTDQSPKWWHPPWNRVTPETAAVADALGLSYCRATVDGMDVNRSDDMIVTRIYEEIADRSIIGLHDGIANNGNQSTPHRNNTIRALERMLTTLSVQYRFVTVSELLR